MRGSKRLPVLTYGSLLVISLVFMIIYWRKTAGYIAAAAACLWVFLLILPVMQEEKRRKRKYHLFIPLTKHQPALPGTADGPAPQAAVPEETAPQDIVTEDSGELPPNQNRAAAPDAEGPEKAAGGETKASAEKPWDAAVPPAQDSSASAQYIGHAESRKFHTLQCTTLPREKNRVYLHSREEAVAKGYSPCTYCKP